MRPGARAIAVAPAAFFAVCVGAAVARDVALEPGADVQAAIDAAQPGDRVVLRAGEHRGPLRLDKSVALEGESGAILRGSRTSSVIVVTAPGASVRGLVIRGSGADLATMDAGVFVERSAAGAVVENNRLEGNLHGVYLHGAENSIAQGNVVIGMRTELMADAGNGVSVWNAPGAKVLNNDISLGRDGIFSIASKSNVFSGNRFHDLRFAVHYMYTNDSEISNNVSEDNAVGYTLMYSNRLIVRGNVSDHDRDHGLLFNYANNSRITGNRVTGALQPESRWAGRGRRDEKIEAPASEGRPAPSLAGGARIGPEKCVFIYNANHNKFRDNWFEGCDIGVHFTAGSEGNEIVGNAFVNNRTQVKYVGTRNLDWSKDGRGNYWSDNPGFDLDRDGVADTAYRPNGIVDRVLWTAPAAKVLINAPAVQLIRWAQSQFPAILPGGVIDSKPLIGPPPRPGGDVAP